ncbi:zinc-binding dehydrogenase [Chitinophaga oryziterrae]|uniref:Zinc-binding dehydrogenase n=1 Tax=Chitinophaga oryziterrae TaxID=1031224 RepID=A0A6N8J9D6_9BACT|nr:NADP-dependent oxidoreductase [Chitinophaga oryziterrae]MVT41594.1 zinc-binding dehydrogenase [Chitinophaga oryziterrae]
MKAIRIYEFGEPEVMKLEETARPKPASDEVLVKTYASGVNIVDCGIRRGGNDILRPYLKLPLTLGWDAAGIIEEVGAEITGFQKGDKVYGIPNFPGDGSYAEYFVAKATSVAIKPQNLTFTEAAGVPLAGTTAWVGVVDYGKIQPGQKILIHGAAGGVGSLAIQIAKAKGAYVIGTASSHNLAFLKELGADEAIDYRSQPWEKILKDIDVIFDASPVRDNETRLNFVHVLRQGGILVCSQLDFPYAEDVKAALAAKQATGELVRFQTYDSLKEMATMIEDGKLKVTISKVYPLEQVAEAHRENEAGHVRGKLVLEIIKD